MQIINHFYIIMHLTHITHKPGFRGELSDLGGAQIEY